MQDVVIIPTYERPEYCMICLEYLSRAHGIEDKEVWVCQDSHVDGLMINPYDVPEDVHRLIKIFGRTFGINARWFCQAPHNTYGNSRNLAMSLKAAYDSGAERIFLVEDDIMVASDFFEWHHAILDEVNPFVSCATSLNKSAHFQINGPDAMDESCKDPNAYTQRIGPYSSHAVAFRRFCVGDLLKYFEREKVEWSQGNEQDICTQKFLKSSGNRSAWPYVPRAFNVGLTSYHINTGMKFNGTFEEKCDALRKAVTDPEKLQSMSAGNQAITPVPTEFLERTGPLVKR